MQIKTINIFAVFIMAVQRFLFSNDNFGSNLLILENKIIFFFYLSHVDLDRKKKQDQVSVTKQTQSNSEI